MFVASTRSKLLKSEVIYDQCPKCRKSNCVQMNVYQLYGCIFFIPFIPSNKTGISTCGNCKQVLKLHEMPASFKLSYDNLKSGTKTPLWNFTGLVLILVAGAFFFLWDRSKMDKYLKNPQKGDVYEVALKSGDYTLYKVEKIQNDSVYFIASKFQTNEASDLDELADKQYETSITYGQPKSRLLSMYKKSIIININRQ